MGTFFFLASHSSVEFLKWVLSFWMWVEDNDVGLEGFWENLIYTPS